MSTKLSAATTNCSSECRRSKQSLASISSTIATTALNPSAWRTPSSSTANWKWKKSRSKTSNCWTGCWSKKAVSISWSWSKTGSSRNAKLKICASTRTSSKPTVRRTTRFCPRVTYSRNHCHRIPRNQLLFTLWRSMLIGTQPTKQFKKEWAMRLPAIQVPASPNNWS